MCCAHFFFLTQQHKAQLQDLLDQQQEHKGQIDGSSTADNKGYVRKLLRKIINNIHIAPVSANATLSRGSTCRPMCFFDCAQSCLGWLMCTQELVDLKVALVRS